MSDIQKLTIVRAVHTAIYLVMVVAIGVLLFSGISGVTGPWLWLALALLTTESVVFALYGFKCPLTSLAVRYGAKTGHVFDTFLPEKVTRVTFRAFGTLTGVALVLLGLRWGGASL